MQSGTFPLRRRGSHPGHGPTRSDARPPLHSYQFVPPQQQSPYGPEYLPMNPPTPMFVGGGLAPGQGGAYAARNPHTKALTSEPAVDPRVPKLRLVSPFLPWPIDVLPSHAKSPSKSPKKKDEAFVTVGDVLTAIHRTLQFGITEGEYFIGSEADRERINNAYKTAMKRKERSKEEGVKRVDFLGERNICVGFRLPESEKEEKWIKERLVTGGEWKPEDVWILEFDEPEDDEE
ncbi:hypothetical protein FRC01_004945 [Tulasnella sp. 417]|nr:hypothetical protein FRC01_004945 [Tulasnella sp. 417]